MFSELITLLAVLFLLMVIFAPIYYFWNKSKQDQKDQDQDQSQ